MRGGCKMAARSAWLLQWVPHCRIDLHSMIQQADVQGSGQYTADNGLYQRFTLSHGYLNKKGYCYKGQLHIECC